MRSESVYHKGLHAFALFIASLLLFQIGFFPWAHTAFSINARTYVANVIGMTAGVAPTELNTLTAELTKRSLELDRREREIDARAMDTSSGSFLVSDYVLSAILLLLLILITMNYIFDFVRAYRIEHNAQVS